MKQIILLICALLGMLFPLWLKNNSSKESNEPKESNEKKLFSQYENLAQKKLETLSLEEKIAQILLVRIPEEQEVETLKQYQFGGYLFFAKDFKNLTKEEVINKINQFQNVSKIPILTAVDEEGGQVVRISSNKNLRETPFLSPRELYQLGGIPKIKEDTIEKSKLLESLGINLNLAPVVDISQNKEDYMYNRSLGEDKNVTQEFAEAVIETSKSFSISYTLKHFPGYGNNIDTHKTESKDTRTLESIKENDLVPFKAGIEKGAEAILVSHNIVTSIDEENPASLSLKIHNLLRNDLNFTGIIITDDISMGATKDITHAYQKAVASGNDLLIVTDYKQAIEDILEGINSKEITEQQINSMAKNILAWKYYKKMMQS